MTAAFALALDHRVRKDNLSLSELRTAVGNAFTAAVSVGEEQYFRAKILPIITMAYLTE